MRVFVGRSAEAQDPAAGTASLRAGPFRATPILVGAGLGLAAGILLGIRASGSDGKDRVAIVTYPPLDIPKPIASGVWIVDSGPIEVAGLSLPVRMTIIRLRNGDLLLHSPTRHSADLARRIEALGTVRHIIAPNVAHWTFLPEWQSACPGAVTWGAPGFRERRQVRAAGVTIDRELGPEAPPEWLDEIAQGIVSGGGGFREAYLFHQASETLVLVDLIESLDPAKLPAPSRLAMRLTGATRDSTAFHVRGVLLLDRKAARHAVRKMVELEPRRVIFAHGRYFADGGAERLRQAFAWLL